MDIGVILTVLWPYLAALYLLDCFLVVRGGHTLFSGTTFTGFRTRGTGLRLTGLLPWDWSILSAREPLILSRSGLYIRSVPFSDDHIPPCADDLDFIPYEEIDTIDRDGRKVLANGKVIFSAATGVAGRFLAGKVKTVRDTPTGDRMNTVERIAAESFDLQAVQKAVDEVKRIAAPMIYGSTLLFLLIFLLVPVSLLVRLPLPWLWGELVLAGMVFLAIATFWWRAHGALLAAETTDRIEELMIFIFFPVSAMHAFGKLTRRLLVPFDGAALTVVLVPEGAEEVLRKEHVKARAAAGFGGGEDLEAVWELRAGLLEKMAVEAGVDLGAAGTRSDALDGEMICPLCAATYREGITQCADCRVLLRKAEVLQETADKDSQLLILNQRDTIRS